MKTLTTMAALALTLGLSAQTKQPAPAAKPTAITGNKMEQDRACIKSMVGIYKVSFNFAETFAPDTGYKFHKPYAENAIEYVTLIEDSPNKIVLQHLLIINDSTIIKHWKQDWVYENKVLYNFYKDNEWIKNTITPEQAKGTWTQKVYQVDDSPRYESFGTWVHVDGKHFWEGVNDSPLPRREFTKRSDYNVMKRHSRMEILADGWVLDQNNEKIIRNNGVDKLLCWERGIEKFTKGNYDATPAIKYWEREKNYWADVRAVWDEVYASTADLKLKAKVDGSRLYESLFELGEKSCTGKTYVAGSAKAEIKKIIDAFMKTA